MCTALESSSGKQHWKAANSPILPLDMLPVQKVAGTQYHPISVYTDIHHIGQSWRQHLGCALSLLSQLEKEKSKISYTSNLFQGR
jgi:hypothetical protein